MYNGGKFAIRFALAEGVGRRAMFAEQRRMFKCSSHSFQCSISFVL
jgi:hypothetical protein